MVSRYKLSSSSARPECPDKRNKHLKKKTPEVIPLAASPYFSNNKKVLRVRARYQPTIFTALSIHPSVPSNSLVCQPIPTYSSGILDSLAPANMTMASCIIAPAHPYVTGVAVHPPVFTLMVPILILEKIKLVE